MLKTVDLFCGAGGLSYGFEATGQFEIIAAAENNKNARETYVANHKGQDDIEMIPDVRGYDFKALKERYGDIDVVIGGPPCQGFSNANRQKNHIISMNNSLVKEYFRAIREIRPKAFVMENVSMLSSETHRFYDSRNDHEEVVRLGVKMKPEELVISEENYDGVDCFYALKNHEEDIYGISDELFQHLNVLYKDRRSKENRLHKYIEKNGLPDPMSEKEETQESIKNEVSVIKERKVADVASSSNYETPDEDGSGDISGEGETPGSTGGPGIRNGKGHVEQKSGTGAGNQSGNNQDPSGSGITSGSQKGKRIPAKIRYMAVDVEKGIYKIYITPKQNITNGSMVIYMSAETDRYKADIISAMMNGRKLDISGNVINGFDVVTDVKAEIMISINYSDICSLEVSVYGH